MWLVAYFLYDDTSGGKTVILLLYWSKGNCLDFTLQPSLFQKELPSEKLLITSTWLESFLIKITDATMFSQFSHIHKFAGLSLSSSHLAGLLTMYSRIRSKEPSARIICS